MSVFNNMTEEEQAAQVRLDELCEKHGVEKFNIHDDDGLVCWRNLVQAMCDIDVNHRKKPGRKAYTQEFILDVGARIDIYRDFVRFDNEKLEKEGVLEQIGETLRRNASIYTVADELRETGEEYTDEQIRGIYDRYRKLRKKEIEDLQNDPCDPDEIFKNMK